jgi:hypothetical protein
VRCHICGEPATGQCQTCWKFYCGAHGDVVCTDCERTRDRSPFAALAKAAAAGSSDQAIPERIPGFIRDHRLRGVIAIGEVLSSERTELTLISLESYGDGFEIRYQIAGRSEPSRTRSAFSAGGLHPGLVFGPVKDDVGGEYQGGYGGGGGGGDRWQGNAAFTPAISDGATTLDVSVEEIHWQSMMQGQRSFAEDGPWKFRISLAGMHAVRST